MNDRATISVRHAGIVVRDMAQCLAFYCGVLGLKPVVTANEAGPFVDELLGLDDTCVRTVKLAAAEGVTLVELLEFSSPGAVARGAGAVNALGPTHVALTVSDLDGMAGVLEANGARFVGRPQVSPDGKVKVAYVADPEGNYLELVEEL